MKINYLTGELNVRPYLLKEYMETVHSPGST